jgi:hypothetical protein
MRLLLLHCNSVRTKKPTLINHRKEGRMATLTPRENLLRVLNGQIPEWVPSYSYYDPLPGVDDVPPNMAVMLMPFDG